MKKLLSLILFLIAYAINAQEDVIYKNYIASVYNESTFQYFTVINFKDLNSSKVYEVCLQGDIVRHALAEEYNLDYIGADYDKLQEILAKATNQYFEFKNKKAIEILMMDYYPIADLEELEKKVNFDKLAKEINKSKKWSILLDKKGLLYAHALFKRGILTGENNCMGGFLYYIDREKPF